jgi:hypothetical protein
MTGPDLRASDADRDAAGERLRHATVEGRLDPAELDQRLSAAYSARYCSELARLTADITPAPQAPARPVFVPPSAPTNGFAIASLVLGILWLSFAGSLLAVVFGPVALRQIARSETPQKGRGFAIAGLSLGYLGTGVLLLGIVALALE